MKKNENDRDEELLERMKIDRAKFKIPSITDTPKFKGNDQRVMKTNNDATIRVK